MKRKNLKYPKFNINGIKSRTLISMFIMVMVFICLLWLTQIFAVEALYKDIKVKELKNISNEVVNKFDQENIEDFRNYINKVSKQNVMTIIVYTFDNGEIVPISIGSSNSQLVDLDSTNKVIAVEQNFFYNFANVLDKYHNASYKTKIDETTTLSTIGQVLTINNNQKIYFYFSNTLTLPTSTKTVFSYQMLFVSVVCIIVCMLTALILSHRLSKPLEDLTITAEKMASGNLNINFKAKGYSEVEQLSRTLNYATQEIEKSENLRKDVVANVSHELRTPLTMIKAYAELIKDINGNDKEKRNKNLDVILDESERLKTLINDFLDLSKLQSKMSEYNMQKINLSILLKKEVEKFSGIFEKEGYVFKENIIDNAYIYADSNRIEQVLFNLVSNAINYSKDNKEITINLFETEKGYKLEICDKGIGIKKEDLDNIFDRFFRTEQTKRTKIGSGIGLSIVKEILTTHSFKFGATSTLGKGSTFYVEFWTFI